MIKVAASALTRTPDPAQAAHELASGLRRTLPDIDQILVMATYGYRESLSEMIATIRTETGCRRIAACTGIGVLSESGEIEEAPGAAAMAFAPGTPIAIATAPTSPEQDSLREMGKAILKELEPISPLAGLLLITSPQIGWPEDLIEELQTSRAPIFGGGLYSPSPELSPRLILEGEPRERLVLAIGMGHGLRVSHGFSQAMTPKKGLHVVTKAQGPHILELDGRPARTVLEEAVGKDAVTRVISGDYPIFLGFPLAPDAQRLERGCYLVRNLSGLHPRTGALITTVPPRVGERLGFVVRDIEAARADMDRMALELIGATAGSKPSFGFYVNCCARGKDFYGDPGVDTAVIRRRFPVLPLIGFFGSYELCPVGERQPIQAYTGVLIVAGS